MTAHPHHRILTAAAVSLAVLAFAAGPAAAKSPAWNPSVTEKLVKLPQEYLKKSLDRDFRRSALADAIVETEQEIQLKLQTLGDLKEAAEQADGELHTELRHQLLAEKQLYLNLMKERQALKKKHLEKRRRVYKRILAKVMRKKQGETPEQMDLVKRQEAAQARFQRTVEAVDMKIFATTVTPQSKYATEYAKNLSAANALLKAIAAHPANKRPTETSPVDKADYLRRLVADTDAELALVQQEQEIVGYMAKLVSLNATALADEIAEDMDAEEETETAGEDSPITSALNHFIQ